MEDHLAAQKAEREQDGDVEMESGDEEGDEEGWKGWDVESDSDEESSDNQSGGWIDIESDGEQEFQLSDSDDEKDTKKKKLAEEDTEMQDEAPASVPAAAPRISALATTKVCPIPSLALNELI